MRGEAAVEYEWLFRTSYPGVLRTVNLIVRDQGRAEEVCQDAYLQLHRHWRTVADYEHPEAWVRRVAIRRAIRSVERERSRSRLEVVAANLTVPENRAAATGRTIRVFVTRIHPVGVPPVNLC